MPWIVLFIVALSACEHVPPTPIDCAAKPECQSKGLCTYDPSLHACQATNATCATTEACRLRGVCTARWGECRPQSNEDCARGEVTSLEGRTQYVALDVQDCMRPMSAPARQKADCWGTTQCHQDGLCGKAKDGACRATHADHCRASLECAQWGRCSLRNGKCIATSKEDCDQGSQSKGYVPMAEGCHDPAPEPWTRPPSTDPFPDLAR